MIRLVVNNRSHLKIKIKYTLNAPVNSNRSKLCPWITLMCLNNLDLWFFTDIFPKSGYFFIEIIIQQNPNYIWNVELKRPKISKNFDGGYEDGLMWMIIWPMFTIKLMTNIYDTQVKFQNCSLVKKNGKLRKISFLVKKFKTNHAYL